MTKLFYEIHYYDRNTGVDSLLEREERCENTYKEILKHNDLD